MEEKFFEFVEKKGLIRPGDRIVAGVSGGADSVCMLLLLSELKKHMSIEIYPVHVEHGIRGDEARQDEMFVRKLCAGLGLSCRVYHVQVPRYAKENRMTLEEAGRSVRYRAFEEAAQEITEREATDARKCLREHPEFSVKIAVAHHRMDNAETILFHLFRGTGLDGMAGILPKQGRVIRPVSCFSRDEIEAYLAARGQSFRTDSTNLCEEYARNRIRRVILPEAEKISANACEHIDQTGQDMALLRDYMEQETEREYQRICVVYREDHINAKRETARTPETGKISAVEIPEEEFKRLHPALRPRILRRACLEISGGMRDILRVHVEALEALMDKPPGKRISLPGNMQGRRDEKGVRIETEKSDDPSDIAPEQFPEFSIETLSVQDAFGDLYEEFQKNGMKSMEIQKKFILDIYTKWFDYDRIQAECPEVRTRREKDYIIINPSGGRKTLKRFFIDEKVPAGQRDHIPLLACGSHILWIYGYRTTEGARITEQTKEVLKITARQTKF